MTLLWYVCGGEMTVLWCVSGGEMTAYDGEGMYPKIKAHYICCDLRWHFTFSSINKPSLDSNSEYGV